MFLLILICRNGAQGSRWFRSPARAVEFDTIDKQVQRGYISKDDGARALGYERAFKS